MGKAHGRGRQSPGAETYIMGLDRDIYGSTIEVQLLDFIRGERKFDSLEELKEQISRDKEAAAGFLRKIQIKRVYNPRTLCYTKSV